MNHSARKPVRRGRIEDEDEDEPAIAPLTEHRELPPNFKL